MGERRPTKSSSLARPKPSKLGLVLVLVLDPERPSPPIFNSLLPRRGKLAPRLPWPEPAKPHPCDPKSVAGCFCPDASWRLRRHPFHHPLLNTAQSRHPAAGET